MIVESFKDGDPIPVYRRFLEFGRLLPDGVNYIGSWVDENLGYCFQLMETDDRDLLDVWIREWEDLGDFEVHAVISSDQALEAVAPRL